MLDFLAHVAGLVVLSVCLLAMLGTFAAPFVPPVDSEEDE